ncbi:ankyrin repeat domain-containing protein [Luteibacter sp. OK325]|uniref:ankyrin repeat domain-containing protein n=1 Tax=Luteibacter sp. OK325 TaxID=2135670 RepID=UPI000D39EF5B|nr:ankyrin repeat domain-containing protein [Luteibacter sp. OK325]
MPPNTSRFGPINETLALGLAIQYRDLAHAAMCLADRADPTLECLSYTPDIHDDDVVGLTPTSMAALVDSTRGELLFLPLLLNRGGNINQVDSRGRTLLHFAWHHVVARYLLEHGAPVPEGLRAQLLDALGKLAGTKVFGANATPGHLDVDGTPIPLVMALRGKNYPWFERCLRPVPDALVAHVVSPGVVADMAALGYEHADTVRPSSASGTPPLIARFDATVEIVHALRERDSARVHGLLKLGAMEAGRFFSCGKNPGDPYEDWSGADALGLAAILDSRAGDVHLMPLFEGFADFHAEHSDVGESLLHLADSPWVCTWLLAHGLSPDAKDCEGETPDEKLSPAPRAIIERWWLNQALPQGQGEGRGRARL